MKRERKNIYPTEKGGDVVFSLLCCCERIHFGLLGAGMCGSSLYIQGVEQTQTQPKTRLAITEHDLSADDFIYKPFTDPSCGYRSLTSTVSHKKVRLK